MKEKKQRKITFTLVLSSISLVILVLSFTGGLLFSSFQQNYTSSIASNFVVSGNETVRQIEYAVKYGKPLDNFYQMDILLQKKMQEFEQVKSLLIATPDGNILYNQAGPVNGVTLPEEIMESFQGQVHSSASFTFENFMNHYFVFLPIFSDDHNWIGSMVFMIDENVINDPIMLHLWDMVYLLIILTVTAALILAIVNFKNPFIDSNGNIVKKRLITSLLIVLSFVQIVFGFNNYKQFSEAYIDLANSNAHFAASIVQKDVESVIQKGVSYDQLHGIENYLEQIVSSIDELAHIQIVFGEDTTAGTYETSAEIVDEQILERFLFSLNLNMDKLVQPATINVILSEDHYSSRVREIILDTLTMIVTSFLFMVEVTIFVWLILSRQGKKKATLKKKNIGNSSSQETDEEDEIGIIRPVAFLFAMAIFMSASFIPIVMKDLYQPILGLSREIILGLPITIEMFLAGLGTLIAGFFIDKKGWKPVFISGVSLFMVGSLLSGIANGPLDFVGARAIVGFGYGFGLMSLRGLVNSAKTEAGRTKGFAAFFAGLYAGLNVGVIVGALLAERLGFYFVFFVAFSVALYTTLFALIMIKNNKISKEVITTKQLSKEDVAVTLDKKQPLSNIKDFLFNKQVVILFLLIIIPTTICSMFLDYYFPVFADNIGVSTSNVGRAFLLNGICIVYLAPLLSKLSSKYLGVEKSIATSGIIIVVGLLIFTSQGTLVAAFIAVVLLGIAESFGLVAQNSYFVRLRATNKLGTGKALGFYDNVRKIGQMAGPMIFGGVAFLGLYGVSLIAIVTLLGVLLFLIMARLSTTVPSKEGQV